MKRKMFSLFSALFLSASLTTIAAPNLALAQASSPAATTTTATTPALSGVKVGVVDVQGAILQTEAAKAAKAKIEKDLTVKRQDIVHKQNALKKLQDDFQAQQAVLSEADKATKQKDFQTKFQDLQQAQTTFEAEVRQKEGEVLQKIVPNMQATIGKIAAQKGLTMVFDKGAGALLYANEVAEITSDVVAQFNKDFKSI